MLKVAPKKDPYSNKNWGLWFFLRNVILSGHLIRLICVLYELNFVFSFIYVFFPGKYLIYYF